MGSKRHHWNPQAYIGNWEGSTGQFHAYQRTPKEDKVLPKNRHGAFAENHLYTVFFPDGETFRAEERLLQSIDSDGAAALRVLTTSDWRTFPQSMALQLYRYLYMLQVRHPSTIKAIAEDDDDTFAELLAAVARLDIRDAADVRTLWNSFGSALNRAKTAFFVILATDNGYIDIFDGISVCVFEAPPGMVYVTSDYPFVSLPRINAKDALHLFPLSPSRLLVLCRDIAKIEALAEFGRDGLVSFANLVNIMYSHEIISVEPLPSRLVFDHLGLRDTLGSHEVVARARGLVLRDKLRIGALA